MFMPMKCKENSVNGGTAEQSRNANERSNRTERVKGQANDRVNDQTVPLTKMTDLQSRGIYLAFVNLCCFFYFYFLQTDTVSSLCSRFSANLPSIFKHYLVLLSSISFAVIPSKCYLFCINIFML